MAAAGRRDWMAAKLVTEMTKETPSRPNATAGPTRATTAPPMAGPTSPASWLLPLSTALPACRAWSGRREGTILNAPGVNIPLAAPTATATGSSSHRVARLARATPGEQAALDGLGAVGGHHDRPRPPTVGRRAPGDQGGHPGDPVAREHGAEQDSAPVHAEHVPGEGDGVKGVPDVRGQLTAHQEPEARVAEGGGAPGRRLHDSPLERGCQVRC